MLTDNARDIRYQLTDARKLCEALGLLDGSKKNAGGLLIRCPAHEERTPSCGVTRGKDGTLRARCFACDWSADAFGIIAQVHGLSTRGDDFREVLAIGADIVGDLALADELRGGQPRRETQIRRVEPPPTEPERDFPPREDVADLWARCVPCDEDETAAQYLQGRSIDPKDASSMHLLRVIPRDLEQLPEWAGVKAPGDDRPMPLIVPWSVTGHRIITRTWAADGQPVSVRAWQCDGKPGPKRLPPRGHAAMGLVLANKAAAKMLAGKNRPYRVVIVEGEPDWVTWSTRLPDAVVLGVGSGWWTQQHADRIPNGTPVLVRTHNDKAGDGYARNVADTIGERCPIWRLEP